MPTANITATVKAVFEVTMDVETTMDDSRPIGVLLDAVAQAARDRVMQRIEGVVKASVLVTEAAIKATPPSNRAQVAALAESKVDLG